jgi:hypothetical protein
VFVLSGVKPAREHCVGLKKWSFYRKRCAGSCNFLIGRQTGGRNKVAFRSVRQLPIMKAYSPTQLGKPIFDAA